MSKKWINFGDVVVLLTEVAAIEETMMGVVIHLNSGASITSMIEYKEALEAVTGVI